MARGHPGPQSFAAVFQGSLGSVQTKPRADFKIKEGKGGAGRQPASCRNQGPCGQV